MGGVDERNKRELVCIRCPIGCILTVTGDADGTFHIAGNSCNRGEEYGRKEITSPTRMVTSTVRVTGGKGPVVPVKTRGDVPKDKIMDCMKALKEIELQAPVHIGDTVLQNVADTGIDMIATKNVEAAS